MCIFVVLLSVNCIFMKPWGKTSLCLGLNKVPCVQTVTRATQPDSGGPQSQRELNWKIVIVLSRRTEKNTWLKIISSYDLCLIFNRVFQRKNPVIEMIKMATGWLQPIVWIIPPTFFKIERCCCADWLYIYQRYAFYLDLIFYNLWKKYYRLNL